MGSRLTTKRVGISVALVAALCIGSLGAAGSAGAASAGLTTNVTVTDDWGSGYCATVAVANPSATPSDWSVTFDIDGTLSTAWNAAVSQTGSEVTAEGDAPWNDVIAAGASYTGFGFCAERSAAPAPDPTPDPDPAPDPDPVPDPDPAPDPTPDPDPVPAPDPTPDPTPVGAIVTPLSTNGATIIGANGDPAILQGVNWFGFETQTQLPHGLWTRDYQDMLAQIASLGYNTIRMPFSVEAIRSTRPVEVNTGVGNAALVGKTPLEAMDIIIDEAARHGLMIILDNHSLANDSFAEGLWYNGAYSEADWVANWELLASRYADRPNVIAADLKNEPHGAATWGTGGATDWRRAAERAGAAVQAMAPHWLIIVEGIEGMVDGQVLDSHWWGGNLEGVRQAPVRLPVADQIVYSPHEYGPGVFAQTWFSLPRAEMEQELLRRWEAGFGYIVEEGIAPVLIGEFGGRDVGELSTVEGRWFDQFANYLAANDISWTFWSWNPNSTDTGGVLDDDWSTVLAAKQARLDQLLRGEYAPQPVPDPDPTPDPDPSPDPTPDPGPTPGDLVVAVSVNDDWGSGYCAQVAVTNPTTAAVDWQVSFAVDGQLTSSWNAAVVQAGGVVTAQGDSGWNDVIASGAVYDQFGFCALR